MPFFSPLSTKKIQKKGKKNRSNTKKNFATIKKKGSRDRKYFQTFQT